VEKARFPIQDNFFDLVISRGALLVAFGNLHTYREIYRVLKPGGKLVFMFGMYPSLGSWARAYLNLKIAGFIDIRKKVKPWRKKRHIMVNSIQYQAPATFSRTITAFKPEWSVRKVIRVQKKSSQSTLL
jgi:SAM-dependent methyltransferase